MNTFIKRALALLLLLSMLFSVSCNTTDEPTTFTLDKDYVIVYDLDAPRAEELAPAVEYLAEALASCGITTTVQDDSQGDAPAEYEIILGRTNRPSSQIAASTLRLNDYKYVVESENEIVICGGNAEATLKAVNRFCSNILGWTEGDGDKSSEEIVVEIGARLAFAAAYDYEDVMIAGKPIENFKIAISSDAHRAAATEIALNLAVYGGYIIPIVNYSDLKETDKNVICIGASDKSGTPSILEGHNGYLISTNTENDVIVSIQASSPEYYQKATERWLKELIVSTEDTIADVDFFDGSTYLFDTDEALPQWYLVSESVTEVADGVAYFKQEFKDQDGLPYKAYSLIVDPTKVTFHMGCSNNGFDYTVEKEGRQTVQDHMEAAIADGLNVVGAVNADFFDINGDYHPTGLAIKDGQIISLGSASRPFCGFTADGNIVIGPSGKKADHSDLVAAVGGSHIIVQNGLPGEIVMESDFGYTAHPRTLVGVREDGTIIFTVIDGRQKKVSNGGPLARCANYMISLGAVTAINLDGGGSSTLITRINGEFVTRNSPSDGKLRKVYNSILIVEK